jgi:hypothetical protein
MPDLDLDDGQDPQDEAEVFDESQRIDDMALSADQPDQPDVDGDLYDVTTAIGDADEDDIALDAADLDPDDLDDDDLEDDEDDDDDLDDDLEDDPEDDEDEDEDSPVDVGAARAHRSEPGLGYTDDLDAATNPRDDDAEKYESTRQLSDQQVADLGYAGKAAPEVETESVVVVAEEERVIRGSGATAEDVEDESDPDDEDRLDEGLEETFPASDPVSAKHIT